MHGARLKGFYRCSELAPCREEIHKSFWSLRDDEKAHFFGKTTVRCNKQRSRKAWRSRIPRYYSYAYFLFKDDHKLRVCRPFYTKTLDVSVKRVHYYHEHKVDKKTGCPIPSRHGRHIKHQLDANSVQAVRDHIKSFPVVESQYCRASTSRRYLDSKLNNQIMYDMFCATYDDSPPAKLHKYREVFSTEFNLSFAAPRKDRCDKCEERKLVTHPTPEKLKRFDDHQNCKIHTKAERDRDRCQKDPKYPVVCFGHLFA